MELNKRTDYFHVRLDWNSYISNKIELYLNKYNIYLLLFRL